MAQTWLSIRVDLIEGHGERYWPRPGRIFAAARSHTFKQLADAIDDAFARWDRSHLQDFALADGRRLCDPDPDWEIEGEVTEDYRRVKLSRLQPGEQFAYVFDLGDDWAHLCTVGARRIDPVEVLGSCRTRRCRTGAGATFPISTGAAGTTTTVSHLRPGTLGSLTFHRSAHIGGLTATGRGEVSRRCSQASADHAITHLTLPPHAATAARKEETRSIGGDFRQVQTGDRNGGSGPTVCCRIDIRWCGTAGPVTGVTGSRVSMPVMSPGLVMNTAAGARVGWYLSTYGGTMFDMALNIKDPETERLAGEVAALTGNTKTGAVRYALRQVLESLSRPTVRQREERLTRFLEEEIWPLVPPDQLGKPLSKAEREQVLGFGEDGA